MAGNMELVVPVALVLAGLYVVVRKAALAGRSFKRLLGSRPTDHL